MKAVTNKRKIVFIFIDGLGLAAPASSNPIRPGSLPYIESCLKTSLNAGPEIISAGTVFKGIDACLGVPGIPQSATGQTALFTGINAAGVLGYHYPAFPNKALVEIIHRENIFRKVQALGRSGCFANAYSFLYFQYVQEKRRRHSVTTHCLLAAGLPVLTLADLRAGRAVFWDITRAALAAYPLEETFPVVTGREAGRHLASLTQAHDLVVFECFLPDLLGHKRNFSGAAAFLALLDEFLLGLRESVDDTVTVVLSSDHGNMEDLSTGFHTQNPVPLLALGPAAGHFQGINDIAGITPAILNVFKDD